MDYILSLITFLPLIGALIIGLFVQGSGSQSSENAKRVSLVTSIIVFLLSLVMFSEFDKNSSDFQFVEEFLWLGFFNYKLGVCLLYTSPSPRDLSTSRMPSSA